VAEHLLELSRVLHLMQSLSGAYVTIFVLFVARFFAERETTKRIARAGRGLDLSSE